MELLISRVCVVGNIPIQNVLWANVPPVDGFLVERILIVKYVAHHPSIIMTMWLNRQMKSVWLIQYLSTPESQSEELQWVITWIGWTTVCNLWMFCYLDLIVVVELWRCVYFFVFVFFVFLNFMWYFELCLDFLFLNYHVPTTLPWAERKWKKSRMLTECIDILSWFFVFLPSLSAHVTCDVSLHWCV